MQIDLIDALQRVLAVHELQLTPLAEPFDQLHRFDYGLRDALDPQFDWDAMGRALLETTPERALLLMEGTFGMRYFIFRLPDEGDRAYIVGPWRSAASREQLQKNLEWFGVRTSQQMRDIVENFYSGIYLMEDESRFGQTVLSLLSAAFPHVDGRQVTSMRRIPGHGTDIWKLEAMNGLCRRLCAVPVPVSMARKELRELLEGEKRYPVWITLAAHFFGAGFFTLFFGGSWADGLCAGGCGVAIGLTLMLMDRLGANLLIKTMAGGGVSALLALGLCSLGLGGSVDLITIGGLMILVPGVSLTNAVRDVMVGDMVSGLSKLAEAVLIGIAIALGTGLALGIAQLF